MLSLFLTIKDPDERLLAERLYLTYKSRMYNVAYAILHNKEDAEDAVMDSVYKIVKNISRFTTADRNKIESLIVIIVRNTAINRYHANRRRYYSPLDESCDIPDGDDPPSLRLVAEEDLAELIGKTLPLVPICRDVLGLT